MNLRALLYNESVCGFEPIHQIKKEEPKKKEEPEKVHKDSLGPSKLPQPVIISDILFPSSKKVRRQMKTKQEIDDRIAIVKKRIGRMKFNE